MDLVRVPWGVGDCPEERIVAVSVWACSGLSFRQLAVLGDKQFHFGYARVVGIKSGLKDKFLFGFDRLVVLEIEEGEGRSGCGMDSDALALDRGVVFVVGSGGDGVGLRVAVRDSPLAGVDFG